MVYAITFEIDDPAFLVYGKDLEGYLQELGYPTDYEPLYEAGEPEGISIELILSTWSPLDAIEGILPIFKKAFTEVTGEVQMPEHRLSLYVAPAES